MSTNKTYTIPLRELKPGRYEFDFEIDDEFFGLFKESEIEHGNVSINADVERHNSMMLINFHLEGEVEVACDRCLDKFYIPIEADNILSVRFSSLMAGNDDDEYLADSTDSEEDIIFVDPTDDSLNITHYLYESICLSLPIQRVHSDDDEGVSLCNQDVTKYLKKHEING